MISNLFSAELTNTLVPVIIPLECDDLEMNSQEFSVIKTATGSSDVKVNTNSSPKLTSLSLGKVIALDEDLEHFLKV